MISDELFSLATGVGNSPAVLLSAANRLSVVAGTFSAMTAIENNYYRNPNSSNELAMVSLWLVSKLNDDFIETGELWHTDDNGKPRAHYVDHPDDRRAIAEQFGLT